MSLVAAEVVTLNAEQSQNVCSYESIYCYYKKELQADPEIFVFSDTTVFDI